MKRLIKKMFKLKETKGFTLIELIATIAILGVLVLLAAPRFGDNVQTAELTKGFADAKSIQKASEQYFMDNEDWPRLTDDPYTSEEIKAYSERIYNTKGAEVNLDPNGNYYNIDYNKLKEYIKVPSNKEDYILQNPVGKVFYMDNLNESGSNRVDYTSNKQANLRIPSKPTVAKETENSYTVTGESGTEVKLDDGEWQTSPYKFTGLTEGKAYKAYSRFKETDKYLAGKVGEATDFVVEVISTVPVNFAYLGSSKSFTVPATGVYKIEVWGAQGGTYSEAGGKGGYSKGTYNLTVGQDVYVYVGGVGKVAALKNLAAGGWNGGGQARSGYRTTTSGGGGTDIRVDGQALSNRIIVAGGGGGGRDAGSQGNASSSSGAGGGTNGNGGSNYSDSTLGTNRGGRGGTQSAGGSAGLRQNNETLYSGALGAGGHTSSSSTYGVGGGGGYYGGGPGSADASGGGGSGYIGGVQNGQTIAGNQSMPNPNGGTMVGKTENGFARITRVN